MRSQRRSAGRSAAGTTESRRRLIALRRRWPVAALVVVGFAGGVLARGGEHDAPAVRERVDILWVARTGGREVAREHVVRETRDDATVVLRGENESHPSADVTMRTTSRLEMDEETFFPLRMHLEMNSRMRDHRITQVHDVAMYANVAVIHTRTPSSESSRHLVMPSGTVFYDLNVIHPLEQFLHAYDAGTGGRQAFDVFDVSRGKLEQAVFFRVGRDTVEALGRRIPVWTYRLERPSMTTTIQADDEGRMIAVDLGYQRYTLESWSPGAPDASGDE